MPHRGNDDIGWALYKTLRSDVVVADLQMSGMEGLSLCRAIRAAEGGVYTYVVLVTSHGSRKAILAGMDSGADDDVTNPLDPFLLHPRLLDPRLLSADRVTPLRI
ncbi:response regulator [Pseudarthrobacter sp. NPDC080039]|uniref:response regulator n=1 Tax=Pseudarthrobacter sp. NPDC080039 TaxID=3155290 RepID=UPI00344F53DB